MRISRGHTSFTWGSHQGKISNNERYSHDGPNQPPGRKTTYDPQPGYEKHSQTTTRTARRITKRGGTESSRQTRHAEEDDGDLQTRYPTAPGNQGTRERHLWERWVSGTDEWCAHSPSRRPSQYSTRSRGRHPGELLKRGRSNSTPIGRSDGYRPQSYNRSPTLYPHTMQSC